jgi:hypothetical protein
MTVRVLDKEGFRSIIAGLASRANIADAGTHWAMDNDPMVGDQDRAKVTLDLTMLEALAVDEHRRTLSDGTDGYPAGTFETLEIGNRELIVNIRVEAYDASVEAAEIIDLIRTGIRAEAITAKLDAIRLAFVHASATTRLPTSYDTRVVSVASADFEFGGIASLTTVILPGVGGDYIASVDTNNSIPGTIS